MKALKVKGLDYEIVPTSKGFQIGCQKITREDAVKIAEFLTMDHRVLPETFHVKIPSKKVGAKFLELLHDYTDIRTHSSDSILESIKEFDSCFGDEFKYYIVRGNELTANTYFMGDIGKELTIPEVMDLVL